jgi:hypothetical protein
MQPIPALVPAKANTPYLLSFCQQLVANELPIYIPNQLVHASISGNCFNNVEQYQQLRGGSVQYGWCLWETPSIILQAEFHAVWRNLEGELIDITPHSQKLRNDQILFLADPHKCYEGTRVNNQRVALLDDPAVHDYLEAQNALFSETQHYMNDDRRLLSNDGERHDAIQQVNQVLAQFKDTHLALERLIKKRFPRNDSCPCGSGLKTKKCCYP